MCNGKRKRPATDEDPDIVASNGNTSTGETAVNFFTAGLQHHPVKPADLLAAAAEPSEPVPVYTGPTKTGPALIAAVAAEAEKQASAKRGKKSTIAAKKPDAAAAPKAEANAKPAAKPAVVRHANAKPDAAAKPAAKPAAAQPAAAKPAAVGDKPAPKPAKPKAAAKPKGENKPAG
jgi:D-alanyl-D-alanine carboxypeptidase